MKVKKIFTKDNICEAANINEEATSFINKLLTYDVTIENIDIKDDIIIVEWHVNGGHDIEED